MAFMLPVLAGVVLAVTALLAPAVAAAWPAIQDATGVYVCQSRPSQGADGQWTCRSRGQSYVGALVEVAPPPGATPSFQRPVPYYSYPYASGPWSRPQGPASGYDELDPWLYGGPPAPER
jgi:hypothetical protein